MSKKSIPFVQREAELCPRTGGFSTALSTRYDAWGGVFEKNHGQHTMVLLEYD